MSFFLCNLELASTAARENQVLFASVAYQPNLGRACTSSKSEWSRIGAETNGGSKPMGSHFGVGAPPMLVYFSGDWDVHWGYGLLTHGQISLSVKPTTKQGIGPGKPSFQPLCRSLGTWPGPENYPGKPLPPFQGTCSMDSSQRIPMTCTSWGLPVASETRAVLSSWPI